MEALDLSKPLDVKAMLDANESQKTGFFEEEPGQSSMMRLASFICIMTGALLSVIIAIAIMFGNLNADKATALAATLLATGFAGKVVQRFAE